MIFWDNVKSLFNSGSQCIFCGTELPLDEHICQNCREEEQRHYKAVINKNGLSYVYAYDGIIRNLLHSLKYGDDISGAYYAAEKMAVMLSGFDLIPKESLITNVPVHKSRKKTRGFDQCEKIAREISKKCGIEYRELFERVKKTKPQFELNARQRAENMKDAFIYIGDNDIESKTVVLIDDICTTGSTLKECVKLLPDSCKKLPFVFAKEG